MKSVLLSIQPKWCELIASGKKTVEIRKTKPKIEPPFKCYIYCTKPSKKYQTICGCMVLNSDELYRHPKDGIKYGDSIELMLFDGEEYSKDNFLNGKVIGEFVCDKITIGIPTYKDYDVGYWDILEGSCLTCDELFDYGKWKTLYGWHISELVIYDKPKELSEFFVYCEGCDKRLIACEYLYEESNESIGYYSECMCDFKRPIKRPPQSWCYVEELEG